MRIRIAAVAAALSMTTAAHATHRSVDDCKKLESNTQRLDCYDEALGRTAADAQPRAKAATSPFDRLTLDQRWDLDSGYHDLFLPDIYRPMYILFADWTDRRNATPSSPSPGHAQDTPFSQQPVEAKYQISFKSKFWRFDNGVSIWGTYTQSSHWQLYNSGDSRPFRETNYEPELLAVFPLEKEFGGGKLRMATLAYNHQSNGRSLPLSRSWNRIVGALVYEKGDWTAELRPWWRIPEPAASDDNPDITDYAGRGELRITRRFNDQFVSVQLRHSLRTGARSHGSVQVDYVFPVPWLHDTLHAQLQFFSGYAESLIDYNIRQTRVGIGITIAGWQ